jgi:predicted transcriptional regulator
MSNSQGSEKEPKVVITARVPQEVADQFNAIAKRNLRSRSAQASLAIQEHVEREAA